MSFQRRFQVDLSEEELTSIERLGSLAGLRTKKEVILNAITLFRWAAKEIMYGRTICSIDEKTQVVKQLELPALSAIVDKRVEPLTEDEIRERMATVGRKFSGFDSLESGEPNVNGEVDAGGGGQMAKGLDDSPAKLQPVG